MWGCFEHRRVLKHVDGINKATRVHMSQYRGQILSTTESLREVTDLFDGCFSPRSYLVPACTPLQIPSLFEVRSRSVRSRPRTIRLFTYARTVDWFLSARE